MPGSTVANKSEFMFENHFYLKQSLYRRTKKNSKLPSDGPTYSCCGALQHKPLMRILITT